MYARLLIFAVLASLCGSPSWAQQTKPAPPTNAEPVPQISYKIIEDPSDLSVAPRKYADRDIEVHRVRCFYADVNEFRCFGGTPLVTIFLGRLTSADGSGDGQKDIQELCDTIKKAENSRDCIVSLRFRFDTGQISEDRVAFYVPRTIIRADTAQVNWPTWTRVHSR